MCIDSQSIIFILVLFKLGQVFSGCQTAARLYQRRCAWLLSGPLMANSRILSGRLIPTPSHLGQRGRTVNLSPAHLHA